MSTPPIAAVIGANIGAERKARNRTQGWLADRIGVGQSRLSNVESGIQMPSVEMLLIIADALGCPVLALIKGAGADSDAYEKGYEDGWRACADGVSAQLARGWRAERSES